MTVPDPRDRRSRRVLVVEDDSMSATMLSLLLEDLGHEVMAVVDGDVALEAGREFRPDVLVSDVRLEGGSDGFEVARAFAADPELSHVGRVVLSALDRREIREPAREAGFDVILTKPVDAERLQEALDQVGAGEDAGRGGAEG